MNTCIAGSVFAEIRTESKHKYIHNIKIHTYLYAEICFHFSVFSDVKHCSLVTSVSEDLTASLFRIEPKSW
jgi:hypothetical protein